MEGGTTVTGMAAITSALGTALSSASDSALSSIATVLPYALAIVGAVIVISVGIRVFKKVAGK